MRSFTSDDDLDEVSALTHQPKFLDIDSDGTKFSCEAFNWIKWECITFVLVNHDWLKISLLIFIAFHDLAATFNHT